MPFFINKPTLKVIDFDPNTMWVANRLHCYSETFLWYTNIYHAERARYKAFFGNLYSGGNYNRFRSNDDDQLIYFSSERDAINFIDSSTHRDLGRNSEAIPFSEFLENNPNFKVPTKLIQIPIYASGNHSDPLSKDFCLAWIDKDYYDRCNVSEEEENRTIQIIKKINEGNFNVFGLLNTKNLDESILKESPFFYNKPKLPKIEDNTNKNDGYVVAYHESTYPFLRTEVPLNTDHNIDGQYMNAQNIGLVYFKYNEAKEFVKAGCHAGSYVESDGNIYPVSESIPNKPNKLIRIPLVLGDYDRKSKAAGGVNYTEFTERYSNGKTFNIEGFFEPQPDTNEGLKLNESPFFYNTPKKPEILDFTGRAAGAIFKNRPGQPKVCLANSGELEEKGIRVWASPTCQHYSDKVILFTSEAEASKFFIDGKDNTSLDNNGTLEPININYKIIKVPFTFSTNRELERYEAGINYDYFCSHKSFSNQLKARYPEYFSD